MFVCADSHHHYYHLQCLVSAHSLCVGAMTFFGWCFSFSFIFLYSLFVYVLNIIYIMGLCVSFYFHSFACAVVERVHAYVFERDKKKTRLSNGNFLFLFRTMWMKKSKCFSLHHIYYVRNVFEYMYASVGWLFSEARTLKLKEKPENYAKTKLKKWDQSRSDKPHIKRFY